MKSNRSHANIGRILRMAATKKVPSCRTARPRVREWENLLIRRRQKIFPRPIRRAAAAAAAVMGLTIDRGPHKSPATNTPATFCHRAALEDDETVASISICPLKMSRVRRVADGNENARAIQNGFRAGLEVLQVSRRSPLSCFASKIPSRRNPRPA